MGTDSRYGRWVAYGWLLLVAAMTVVLFWSRLTGLGLSFYHDEIYTITRYVHKGPRGVFFGAYEPNNHMLFSLLTWITWTFTGDSEIALRIWAVVPSLVATLGLGLWAARRFSVAVGTTVVLVLTTSPFVAQHAVLARGYGLALAAMSGALVAGFEAIERDSRRYLVLSLVFGLVGVLILPVFVLAFLGIVFALWWARPGMRRLIGVLVLSLGTIALVWYAPVLSGLVRDSAQTYGEQISLIGVLGAPIRFLLFPTFRLLVPGVQYTVDVSGADSTRSVIIWYLLGGFSIMAGSFHLWRVGYRKLLVLLVLPVLVSFVALALLGFFVETRFVGFLLVPLAFLIAFGVEATLSLGRQKLRTSVATGWLVIGAMFLVAALPDYGEMTSTPIEAFKQVGQLVSTTKGEVFTNSQRPTILAFYIDRDLTVLNESELEAVFCSTEGPFVFIEHPLLAEPVDTSCLALAGAQRTRFLQRDRGRYIDVWEMDGP